MRKHLTYANVMVTLLAFLVLAGGGAYAASKLKLGKNSVGTKQLKNNAVTRAKIKKHAVNTAKLDPSVLAPYAKRGEFLNGNDVISPDPAAGLGGAIYNVGGGGGDCQGANAEFPNDKADDIDFSTVEFDSGGLAHTEPGAAPNCYNGFKVGREGTYAITAWIGWEANDTGDREVTLNVARPGKKCCQLLAVSEQAANDSDGGVNVTAQTVSAIVRLEPNASVLIQGRQTSGGTLSFFGGGIQIAFLGS